MKYFLVLLLAVGWLALMPPFFTHGACDVEFEKATADVAANHAAFASPELARSYWQSRAVPVSVLSAQQCRHVAAKFLDRCGPGTLVYAALPVKNPICRFYRDESITIQLAYDLQDRLSRVETDMRPFKSLQLPVLGETVYWGK